MMFVRENKKKTGIEGWKCTDGRKLEVIRGSSGGRKSPHRHKGKRRQGKLLHHKSIVTILDYLDIHTGDHQGRWEELATITCAFLLRY